MTETQKEIEQEAEELYPAPPKDKAYMYTEKYLLKRIGFIAGRSKSLEEKEKEISDLREDLAEQTKVIRKQLEVIDNLGNESKRLKELIRVWWLIANRIKPQEAEQMLGAKEFIDYMRSVESMYNKFKTENNL